LASQYSLTPPYGLEVEDYYPGIFYTAAALTEVLTEDSSTDGGDPLFGRHIDKWHLALAIVVFISLAVVTRGRILFWIGGILTRNKFGEGRSGGGGAKGRF